MFAPNAYRIRFATAEDADIRDTKRAFRPPGTPTPRLDLEAAVIPQVRSWPGIVASLVVSWPPRS
jgi:hypothetical protein